MSIHDLRGAGTSAQPSACALSAKTSQLAGPGTAPQYTGRAWRDGGAPFQNPLGAPDSTLQGAAGDSKDGEGCSSRKPW